MWYTCYEIMPRETADERLILPHSFEGVIQTHILTETEKKYVKETKYNITPKSQP